MDFDPVGFGERLTKEMVAKGWGIEELHLKVRDKSGGARGSSYGSVWSYVHGKAVFEPRREISEAFADLFGVLPDYLLFGTKPRTEFDREIEQTALAAAREQEQQSRGYWNDHLKVLCDAFGEGSERLVDDGLVMRIVLDTSSRLLSDGLAKAPPIGGIRSPFLDYDPDVPDPRPGVEVVRGVHRGIGRALRSPFAGLTIEPKDLTDDEFTDYVSFICHGLRRLVDAHERRRTELLPPPVRPRPRRPPPK